MVEVEKYKAYVIKWRDHFYTEGWQPIAAEEVIGKEVIVTTIGFFIGEDEHYYHFAQSVADDSCLYIMSVIKADIVDLDELP